MGGNGTLALLCGCNGPGGTYTASLMRRGLVLSLKRGAVVNGQGKGKSRDLYYLGPAALAILEAAACREQNGRFSLKEMAKVTPAVNPVEAMRKAMALGLSGEVKEKDAADLIAKLKEMAMAGNLKAMAMWFKLTMGDKPMQDDHARLAVADAIADLVDEIRIAKDAPPAKPAKLRHVSNGPKDDDEDD